MGLGYPPGNRATRAPVGPGGVRFGATLNVVLGLVVVASAAIAPDAGTALRVAALPGFVIVLLAGLRASATPDHRWQAPRAWGSLAVVNALVGVWMAGNAMVLSGAFAILVLVTGGLVVLVGMAGAWAAFTAR